MDMFRLLQVHTDYWDLTKFMVPVLVVIIGWIAAHYFNSIRDRTIKRNELVTSHLINAYRVLTHDINKRQLTAERREKLENIISDLQLFGSHSQIALTKKLLDHIRNNREFPLDDLVNNLRNDLRTHLGLKKIQGNVRWLRFEKKN